MEQIIEKLVELKVETKEEAKTEEPIPAPVERKQETKQVQKGMAKAETDPYAETRISEGNKRTSSRSETKGDRVWFRRVKEGKKVEEKAEGGREWNRRSDVEGGSGNQGDTTTKDHSNRSVSTST
ncbi:hypothetical protein BLNAU_5060 [Blattamonas nauphoetae]|uniref:Uncharacterized protein n=1 Tax=Blattamonas nauphoetae TaxID=2049346 RepID=A0ABQ9Y7X9_9EUKA|nr:hypothetical protein BLNAU_8507 [Blattamonas nauphoetae]KAK2959863.1 hypothetical protein BLNAU_5060 [Blattamonas nauphoetae]